ncbi:hypothetical protein ACHQM5_028696 [Ranunculus cassubicifolius]
MARLRPRTLPSFNKPEIEKMERIYEESGEETLFPDFCDKLARQFSRGFGREGKPAIQMEQVQDWFKRKHQNCKRKSARNKKQNVLPAKRQAPTPTTPSLSDIAPELSASPKDDKLPDLSELEFEAKSTKDGAWYDVSIFLTHRVVSSGEPEVRVRFVGFGAEEDEWVNVKTGVRERSLPLESTECHKVKEGDVVLCFQERKDQAIYYDAHVVSIQRRVHDVRGCRCLFLVRYDHDNIEERILLRRICRRPSY